MIVIFGNDNVLKLTVPFFVWIAFAELQTDLTDLTSDLEGLGMPFVSQREYATNMLFVALESKPMTSDPEVKFNPDGTL